MFWGCFRQSVCLFDEFVHQIFVFRLALFEGFGLCVSSSISLSQQFQSFSTTQLSSLFHVILRGSLLVEKKQCIRITQFGSLQEVISSYLFLFTQTLRSHQAILVEKTQVYKSLTVTLHCCLFVANLGLLNVLADVVSRVVVISQFDQSLQMLQFGRFMDVVIGTLFVFLHTDTLLLENTHQIQCLRVVGLCQDDLSQKLIDFYVDFALNGHLIVEHTLNELQFALTVIQLSSLYVQRSCLFEIFLNTKPLLVTFSKVQKGLTVSLVSCSFQVLDSSLNVGSLDRLGYFITQTNVHRSKVVQRSREVLLFSNSVVLDRMLKIWLNNVILHLRTRNLTLGYS